MWASGPVPRWRAADGTVTAPIEPAMMTLRLIVAHLASMIRSVGIAYIVIQVAIWHGYYEDAPQYLVAPGLAVAWAVMAVTYLRRRSPSARFAVADSAVYLALALFAQVAVPPGVRDDISSWVVIAMSGQLMIPAWYAPDLVAAALAVAAPLAYLAGATALPVTSVRMMVGAAALLLIISLVHRFGRGVLYPRAAAADAEADQAGHAAREQYAALSSNVARREHERLVHDTVLNTLTAVIRGGDGDVARTVARCGQDVAMVEAALGGATDLNPADLVRALHAVAADLRGRGLTVHLDEGGGNHARVPSEVVTALASAAREALANVAAHAGTAEAWVTVHHTAPAGDGDLDGVRVAVRDQGTGFDPDTVDPGRLGLRRSITERVTECGGRAIVRSQPGRGTTVVVCWPAGAAWREPQLPGPARDEFSLRVPPCLARSRQPGTPRRPGCCGWSGPSP